MRYFCNLDKRIFLWPVYSSILSAFCCEIRSCNGALASHYLLGRAIKDNLAAHGTAAGTEFDEVVAMFQHLQIVFDEEDGVACFDHGVEEVEDSLDVVEVEAIGRLVHNEDFACVAKIGSQFDALQLTAREGRE